MQGYNAQAVTTCDQVIVAAALTQQANHLQQLKPMLDATAATLAAAGITQRPGALLADSGYWTIANLTQIPGAPELLIPPAKHGRQGKPRKDGQPSASRSDGLRAAMTAKLATDDGKAATLCASRPSSRSSGRSNRFSDWFAQHAAAAGLPRITLHGLRHSYATAALKAGVPLKVMSERLGHATVAITLDIYSHVIPGMDELAANTVAGLILGDDLNGTVNRPIDKPLTTSRALRGAERR